MIQMRDGEIRYHVRRYLRVTAKGGRRPQVSKGVTGSNLDLHEAEMEQRRAKPNPAARPSPQESAALTALRASLKNAATDAERIRIENLIRNLEACYRPPGVKSPAKRTDGPAPRPMFKSGTVKAFAAALLQHVDHHNADGRAVGLHVAEILRRVAARFPDNRLSVKDLERIRDEARDLGATYPIRPRARAGKRSAAPLTDSRLPTPANGRRNAARHPRVSDAAREAWGKANRARHAKAA